MRKLDTLKKADLTELKSFANPPEKVKACVDMVSIMMGKKQEWNTQRNMLADPNLLHHMKTYKKDSIAPAIIAKVKPILNRDGMEEDSLRKVS